MKEALKLALEALLWANNEINEWMNDAYGYEPKDHLEIMSAITAIKEALAQPEQEPVGKLQEATAERAWFTTAEINAWADKKLSENPHWVMPKDEPERDEPPPQRKPLTEQEIGAILEDINAFGTRLYTFARAIEAAHGIKGEL